MLLLFFTWNSVYVRPEFGRLLVGYCTNLDTWFLWCVSFVLWITDVRKFSERILFLLCVYCGCFVIVVCYLLLFVVWCVSLIFYTLNFGLFLVLYIVFRWIILTFFWGTFKLASCLSRTFCLYELLFFVPNDLLLIFDLSFSVFISVFYWLFCFLRSDNSYVYLFFMLSFLCLIFVAVVFFFLFRLRLGVLSLLFIEYVLVNYTDVEQLIFFVLFCFRLCFVYVY